MRNANGTQELLPKSVLNVIPALYAQDGKGEEAIAYVKYFFGGWTWYGTEFNPEDGTFFGKVYSPMEPDGELGYFNIHELAETSVRGMAIERDTNFKPKKLVECRNPCTTR
jgi:hypothetical protein